MELVIQIIKVCVVPLLGILTKFLIDYLTAKRDAIKTSTSSEIADKYTDLIYRTVVDCVTATNQTYVEALKKEGAFTPEAQKEAFTRTLNAVLAILSEDAKTYIREATGDLTTYLTNLIEAQVHANKA